MAYSDKGEDEKDRGTEGDFSGWWCPWDCVVALCAINVKKLGHCMNGNTLDVALWNMLADFDISLCEQCAVF